MIEEAREPRRAARWRRSRRSSRAASPSSASSRPACSALRDELRTLLPGAESAALAARGADVRGIPGARACGRAAEARVPQLGVLARARARPLSPEGLRRDAGRRRRAEARAGARRRNDRRRAAAEWPARSATRPSTSTSRCRWRKRRCCRRCATPRPTPSIVADGTSCRHQIHDGAARDAVHVARVLEECLPASR